MIVFGTRPEAIKLAPVIQVLKNDKYFETIVCSTGQHREMLSQVLDIFNLSVDDDLDLMKPDQTLFDITANSLTQLKSSIEKYNPDKVYSVIYWDAEQDFYYVKRFVLEESEKPQCFINEHPESKLISITEVEYPRFELHFGGKHKSRDNEIIEVAEFIGVKSYKAKGRRLTSFMIDNIREIEPVVKKEAPDPVAENGDEEPQHPLQHIDPAQMKLEL